MGIIQKATISFSKEVIAFFYFEYTKKVYKKKCLIEDCGHIGIFAWRNVHFRDVAEFFRNEIYTYLIKLEV